MDKPEGGAAIQRDLKNWGNGPTGTSWSSVRTIAKSCGEGGIIPVLLRGQLERKHLCTKGPAGPMCPCGEEAL